MKTVVMKSELYGEETFEYDNEREAKAGMKRLKKSAKEHEKKDGVKREIWME